MMNKSFMRRAFLQALAPIGLLLLSGSLASADQVLSIPLNNAERLKIRGTAKDIIIANPAVADVTVLEPDQFIIIGKQAGRTTLLILDSQERVLLSSMVVVSDGSGGLVTVHAPRGDTIKQKEQEVQVEETDKGDIRTTILMRDRFVPTIAGIDFTPGPNLGRIVTIR